MRMRCKYDGESGPLPRHCRAERSHVAAEPARSLRPLYSSSVVCDSWLSWGTGCSPSSRVEYFHYFHPRIGALLAEIDVTAQR